MIEVFFSKKYKYIFLIYSLSNLDVIYLFIILFGSVSFDGIVLILLVIFRVPLVFESMFTAKFVKDIVQFTAI